MCRSILALGVLLLVAIAGGGDAYAGGRWDFTIGAFSTGGFNGSLTGSCVSGKCDATVSGSADGKQLSQTLQGVQKGNQATLTNKSGSTLVVTLSRTGKTQVQLSLKSGDGKSFELSREADAPSTE